MMSRRSFVASTVTVVLVLSCMIESSQAWIRREIEAVNPEHDFRLRKTRRMKKDKKDSKTYKSYKSSKSGGYQQSSHHYYGYHYDNAGFLDEDVTGDFEDMFGYIVTADHFSYPYNRSSKSSKKSKKSSKSSSSSDEYYYGSYPVYVGKGGGGKGGKKNPKMEKLPYYEPGYHIGSKSQKDTKLRPPKLTRPPSSPIGPPGGPPALQSSPDEPDEPSSAVPTDLNTAAPATPTPTASAPDTPTGSAPDTPTETSEEPTAAPGSEEELTDAPTTSGNETGVDGTKSLEVTPVSFSLYSLTYTLEDNVMPTREEDFTELTTVTRTTFGSHMSSFFEDYPLTVYSGFQTEFVRTGTTVDNQLYVVFQSTVLFDEGSFMIPEASQMEEILQDGLAQNAQLWMEYIAALQEMDEDNAFASTVNVVYSDTPPDGSSSSSAGSSSAVAAIAAAAAGVTVIAIGLFVMKRKREAATLVDGTPVEKKMRPSRSLFGSNKKDDSDTESNTYGESSFGLQTVPLTATVGSTVGVDEEQGTLENDSVYLSGEKNTKTEDWENYNAYNGYDKNDSDDDYSEYSDDAVASKVEEDSSTDYEALIGKRVLRTSKISHPWDDASSFSKSRQGELTERQRGGKTTLRSTGPSEKETKQQEQKLSRESLELEAQRRSQEDARKLEEKKLEVKRAELEEWLEKEKMARLDEERRLTEERLQAELAKIKAEAAARAAQDLRKKEESRFAAEKEAFETKRRQQEKARKVEEQKLAMAREEFDAMIRKEKEDREALEARLVQEKQAADESLRKAVRRAERAEERIKKEKCKLKEAKEAMEAKQQMNDGGGESNAFLEEEELYLRQLRSAEQAREENAKASKEVARATDIRKLQQMRFEEKEKDLEQLRLKEAEAAESAESTVKAGLTPEETRIWDQAREISQVVSPLKNDQHTTEGEGQDENDGDNKLAMALRLARSWSDPPPPPETWVHQSPSWDSSPTSLKESESLDENYEVANDSETSDEVVAEEDQGEGSMEESSQEGAESQTAATRSSPTLPGAVKRAAQKLEKDIAVARPTKIGAATFIAPWKDEDERDEKRRKNSKSRRSSKYKTGYSARAASSGAACDESMYSASQGSTTQASGTVTSTSVDDDDTCSEFSLRTNTTLSSGLSKILPR